MPTGLREIESSFKQVQKDYQSYAKRRQVLAIEVCFPKLCPGITWFLYGLLFMLKVAAQENSLRRIKAAICEERQAISMKVAICCPQFDVVVTVSLSATVFERQLLHQEKEAFEVFRKEVLRDLQTHCAQLQVHL